MLIINNKFSPILRPHVITIEIKNDINDTFIVISTESPIVFNIRNNKPNPKGIPTNTPITTKNNVCFNNKFRILDDLKPNTLSKANSFCFSYKDNILRLYKTTIASTTALAIRISEILSSVSFVI